ncbi:MAG: ABC transporter permease [Candidatus Hydrogenedentota bacterium]|nr:MAG: ABC transporter permease [Candidatus Hydrogenedentota bacterium]
MKNTAVLIPLTRLAFIFFLVGLLIFLFWRWRSGSKRSTYAFFRMIIQLLLVGYVLALIFHTESAGIVLLTLSFMLSAAAWIALSSVPQQRKQLYFIAFLSVMLGGGFSLFYSALLVLQATPWYKPNIVIPLAGMSFANGMNAVSLAAERFFAELNSGKAQTEARNIALKAGLIPITNALFSVGLVALPGMMTGQILAGVDPLIAVRYQIMIMSMTFTSAGFSAVLFLTFVQKSGKKLSF